MLLVIDVGNTNLVLGVYKGDKLIKCWRMATGNKRTADEVGIFIHSLFDATDVNARDIKRYYFLWCQILCIHCHWIRKYFGIEPMIVGVGIENRYMMNVTIQKKLGQTES